MPKKRTTIMIVEAGFVYSMTLNDRLKYMVEVATHPGETVEWSDYTTCLGPIALEGETASKEGIISFIKGENA
jgi:hypothetical protein